MLRVDSELLADIAATAVHAGVISTQLQTGKEAFKHRADAIDEAMARIESVALEGPFIFQDPAQKAVRFRVRRKGAAA